MKNNSLNYIIKNNSWLTKQEINIIKHSNKILREGLINKFKRKRLYEGLIVSYPIEKVNKIISNKIKSLNLKIKIKNEENENQALPYFIMIMKDNYTINNIKEIIKLLKTMGWNFGYALDKDNNDYKNLNQLKKDNKFIDFILFRAKHDSLIPINKRPIKLYHITSLNNLDKILKNGLIPKSKNKKIKHEDAIYLFDINNKDDIKTIINYLSNYNDNDLTLLEIDLKYMGNDFKLYGDPDLVGITGYFTKENISPSRIKPIKIFKINEFY